MDNKSETEQELRALMCKYCKQGLLLSKSNTHHVIERTAEQCEYMECTYNPELLPLFNAGIAGAYAAAAKEAGFRVRFLITGTPDEQAAHIESCILALTPADARLAQTGERMDCGHSNDDWIPYKFVPNDVGRPLGSYTEVMAHCRTCAAIASAEARARLESEKWWAHEKELAVARTPDGGTIMKRLNYNNPGTKVDLDGFMVNMSIKSKEDLLLIVKHVAECCDMRGKGYVNEFEDTIRRVIGYTQSRTPDSTGGQS